MTLAASSKLMKNTMLTWIAVGFALITVLLPPHLTAQGDVAGDPAFEELREEYNKRHDELRAPLQQLAISYEERLKLLEEELKAKGDLEKLLKVRDEIQAVAKGETTPTDASFQSLHQLQQIYLRNRDQRAAAYNKGLAALQGAYCGQLTALKKELTQEDKIKEALLVNRELETMQAKLQTSIRAVAPVGTRVACTLHWSCADVADVYLNGKPLRDYSTDFRRRPDEAPKRFSAKADLRDGDVLTVGARRGGSWGFLLVAVDANNKVVWRTDDENWSVYSPKSEKDWHLPRSAAGVMQKKKPTIQPHPWSPQKQITDQLDPKAASIWTQQDAKTTYLVSTIKLR